MKPYPEYKETLIPWLPEIPTGWELRRAGAIFDEVKENNAKLDYMHSFQFKFGRMIYKKNEVNHLDNSELATIKKYTIVQPNDIVINGLNLNYDFVTLRVAIVEKKGIITSAYLSIRPIECQRSQYLNYVFKSYDSKKILHAFGRGIRKTLSFEDFKVISCPFPPIEEQYKIVRFLDWKLSRINKFIRAKRREIELLKEQKQAVINQVVTRGLDPAAELRDSGIPCLGKIPKHWKVKRLRELLSAMSVKNHPNAQLLSVVRDEGVILRDLEDTESNHNYIPDDLSNYKFVQRGQFVMNKMKAWQGSYGVSEYDGIVSPAYYIFDLKGVSGSFFHQAIRSKFYVPFFGSASDGIRVGQWDLSQARMRDIRFIIPSESEQEAIVEYIRRQTTAIDLLIAKATKSIDLIAEYKDRLISDAVTGRIDLRDTSIPDFAPETVDEEAEPIPDTELNEEEI